MKIKRGFTLIELLIVIAIISILATVILVNLSNGRTKAKASSALQSLRSAQSSAILCRDAGQLLGHNGYPSDPRPAAGAAVCASTGAIAATWSDITSTGWKYSNETATTTAGGDVQAMKDNPDPTNPANVTRFLSRYYRGETNNSLFNYGAYDAAGGATNSTATRFIRCNEKACGKKGF